MEIFPIIGQTRPTDVVANPESEDHAGLFATLVAEAEAAAGGVDEGLTPAPPPPELAPATQEEPAAAPPLPAPAMPSTLTEAKTALAEQATALVAEAPVAPPEASVENQDPTEAPAQEEPDTAAGLGLDLPANQAGTVAPDTGSLPAKTGGGLEGPTLPRPDSVLPQGDQAEGKPELSQPAGGRNVTPAEISTQAEQPEGQRLAAGEPNQRSDREARARAPETASADRQAATAPPSEGANSGELGGDTPDRQGRAKAGAAFGGAPPMAAAPQASTALSEAGSPAPSASLPAPGPAATPESGSFATTLDKTLGRAAPAPGDQSEQLAIRIQKAVHAGQDRISLRLHPAELGRIDIQLDFAEDGRLRAAILAERSEALDLLQRDARILERALHDAGLKTDSGSFTFDLREQASHERALRGGESEQQEGEPDQAEDAFDPAGGPERHANHEGLLDLVV